jgi:hypothetical protein
MSPFDMATTRLRYSTEIVGRFVSGMTIWTASRTYPLSKVNIKYNQSCIYLGDIHRIRKGHPPSKVCPPMRFRSQSNHLENPQRLLNDYISLPCLCRNGSTDMRVAVGMRLIFGVRANCESQIVLLRYSFTCIVPRYSYR